MPHTDTLSHAERESCNRLAEALAEVVALRTDALESRIRAMLASVAIGQPAANEPLLTTIDGAATLLSVSPSTIRAMVGRDELSPIRVGADGRGIRIAVQDLHDWIRRQKQSGPVNQEELTAA